MFKKKGVKKFDDMSKNNNSSSGEELSEDELFNVAGGNNIPLRKITEEDRENPEYKEFFACGDAYSSDPPRGLIDPSWFDEN